jgi:2-oxoglutarate ferredoxin oxidoreductase subunit beta
MMKALFKHPESILKATTSFCPGCGHGIIHRLVADVIDKMHIREKTIGIVGVGCSSQSWGLFNFDFLAVPHGRPCAGATGVKRSLPDHFVFTYQGDGDAYAIGLAETMHAAIRGEKITVIVVNNTVFAMTGGQMAPTALEGQVTCTSPVGRDTGETGQPFHFPELIANIPGVAYSARVAVDSIPNIQKAGKAIEKAFHKQQQNAGFSIVEILSPCPTVFNVKPADAMDWVAKKLELEFPLGEFADR